MQYFWSNKNTLDHTDNEQVKQLASCTTPLSDTEFSRTCFDQIGVPIQAYNVFGDIKCTDDEGTSNYDDDHCNTCDINASGLQFTFLINRNDYSQTTVELWEKEVFIRNVKSFNQALGNDYHTEMTGPMEGIDYNLDLISEI